jgi:transposase
LILNEKKRKRWSRQARKEVVLRILAGESIEELSRELQEETYRLEEWRDAAVAAMDIGLQGKGKDVKDKEIEQARTTIGRLTMELELYRGKAKRRAL